MDKKIMMNDITTMVKSEKSNSYKRIFKNLNLEINENDILSIVSDSEEERKNIGQLISGEIKPIKGKISYIGDYFENKKEYQGNKIEFIKYQEIENLNKDKTIIKFLKENILNQKFLNENYKKSLVDIRKRIADVKKEISIYKDNKEYLKNKIDQRTEFYKEKITEINSGLKKRETSNFFNFFK